MKIYFFGAYNICLKDGNLGIFRVSGLDGGGGGGDGGGGGLFNKIGFLVCILAMVFFFFSFSGWGRRGGIMPLGGGREKLAYGVVFCFLF